MANSRKDLRREDHNFAAGSCDAPMVALRRSLPRLRQGQRRRRSTSPKRTTFRKNLSTPFSANFAMPASVYSRKGPGGGYKLARAPSEIKIDHVIPTTDAPLAPLACASRTAYQPCRDRKAVKASTIRLMMKVRDLMSEVLDRATIAEMVAIGQGGKARSRSRNHR